MYDLYLLLCIQNIICISTYNIINGVLNYLYSCFDTQNESSPVRIPEKKMDYNSVD